MEWLLANKDTIIAVVTAVVTCAAAIAALTPNTKDDGWVGKLQGLVNMLALNVGKAKNKGD